MSDKKRVSKNPMFNIGDIVKHRIYPFRGVIVDVDPEFQIQKSGINQFQQI